MLIPTTVLKTWRQWKSSKNFHNDGKWPRCPFISWSERPEQDTENHKSSICVVENHRFGMWLWPKRCGEGSGAITVFANTCTAAE